jgi:hypothetical protein
MALEDIAAKFDPAIPHKTCAVCFHMAERGDVWSDKMRGLLGNRGIRFRDLARELADDPDEPNIPASTLSRHAQAGCSANENLR